MPPTSLPPNEPRGDRDPPERTDPTDYEQLRRHLALPRREHPAARQRPAAPAPDPAHGSRVSVMEWLLAVGRAVTRRVRRAP
ncbi:MAG TPA: hypothetical protein VK601_05290, partial [Kofleriaceae bacterium]|nr:hypothetical protein [Kofleriaceae bacterium]